ncbi:MAG TPA: molybdate ABC transporter substrate-binding protein [Gammaproteobacteria bacterium]
MSRSPFFFGARAGSRGALRRTLRCGALLGLVLALVSAPLAAETVTVAVAANFVTPLQALAAEFESASGHELTAVPGSTGQLYAQIVNGAPFDVLLAADQERPRRLVDEGRADRASLFTYAVGRLVLWTRDPEFRAGLALETLRRDDYRWLAIAQPDLAPYGAAARQVLREMSLWEALQGRIVFGPNIGQTFAMAETGNAELALVALSQALAYDGEAAHVVVPPELHEPIRQDAVLLTRATGNRAAVEFLAFLESPDAEKIIERFGYLSEPNRNASPSSRSAQRGLRKWRMPQAR